jgi:hypothetical protein
MLPGLGSRFVGSGVARTVTRPAPIASPKAGQSDGYAAPRRPGALSRSWLASLALPHAQINRVEAVRRLAAPPHPNRPRKRYKSPNHRSVPSPTANGSQHAPVRSPGYLNWASGSSGGEWLWGGVCLVVPRAPGLIWVLGLGAGDVMVDGSSHRERLRPLGLCWSAACGRESQELRELAGRLAAIGGLGAWRKVVGGWSVR